ncbi:RHS repeat-associated core domain-containing protein, partial [Porphyromonadaceae bacterium OttesenSCG-928-L07]|nr:RHS repeat-associated core domain-containing protein [Porphyromonadaceae bacterium OttesenSCG-928-L07]
RFRYNGKERHNFGGNDYHDYGARMYDPYSGRWLGVDPLAEKYYSMGAYVYCANNPVRYIDPDGRFMTDYYNLMGNLVKHIDDNSNEKKLVLTSAKKMDKVDEAIASGAVVSVPSNEVVNAMEQAFQKTEVSGNEHGFRVGNNGTVSTTVEGTSDHISTEAWQPAIDDLREKGDKVSYDVHTHTKGGGDNAQPSETDRANIVGNQPNVVLGYKVHGGPNHNTIGGVPVINHVRQIGFFNSTGLIAPAVDFSTYKRAVKIINKK